MLAAPAATRRARMYLPRAFHETDLTALDRLIERDPFVTLVTVADGAPVVSHLPVLYARSGTDVVIDGHWARPNPQSAHTGSAVAIVHGPHAYVSPGAYPDKEAAARVPTWNYAVAHLHGTLQRIDDEDALAAHVAALGTRFEHAIGADWRFEPDRPDHRSQLRGILGFRFRSTRIELKFKLNQNHPRANREAVADDLARRAPEVAALMRAVLQEH